VVRRHVYRDFGEFNLITREGEVSIPRVAGTEPLLGQALHFLDCVRSGVTPTSDVAFGAKVVKVLEAYQVSMDRGGAPVVL
jgi:predicted dehydrogenase